MKKLLKILALLLVVGLMLGLAGCPPTGTDNGGDYGKYFASSFRNNGAGRTEIINPTGHDMLLFDGELLAEPFIIGGVRAGQRANLNFEDKSNYQVGSFVIVRAVKVSQFSANGEQAIPDHSAMVTYGANRNFTVTLMSTTDGNFGYRVHNNSRDYALELRENSPEGRVVAFLTRGEYGRVINTPNNDARNLYPVWVAFNNQTQNIVTFTPTGVFSNQLFQPDPVGPGMVELAFPAGNQPIVFDNIILPFANLTLVNNAGWGVQLRTANQPMIGQGGINVLAGGRRADYEFISDEVPRNLNVYVNNAVEVPVRFEDETDMPTFTNGHAYTIVLTQLTPAPSEDPNDWTAVVTTNGLMNTADLLSSP